MAKRQTQFRPQAAADEPAMPPPQPNGTRVAFLSDLAATCRKFQDALYEGVKLTSEGAGLGHYEAMTQADLVNALADTKITDAAVLAEFVGRIGALIDEKSKADPSSSYRNAIQRLARASR